METSLGGRQTQSLTRKACMTAKRKRRARTGPHDAKLAREQLDDYDRRQQRHYQELVRSCVAGEALPTDMGATLAGANKSRDDLEREVDKAVEVIQLHEELKEYVDVDDEVVDAAKNLETSRKVRDDNMRLLEHRVLEKTEAHRQATLRADKARALAQRLPELEPDWVKELRREGSRAGFDIGMLENQIRAVENELLHSKQLFDRNDNRANGWAESSFSRTEIEAQIERQARELAQHEADKAAHEQEAAEVENKIQEALRETAPWMQGATQ